MKKQFVRIYILHFIIIISMAIVTVHAQEGSEEEEPFFPTEEPVVEETAEASTSQSNDTSTDPIDNTINEADIVLLLMDHMTKGKVPREVTYVDFLTFDGRGVLRCRIIAGEPLTCSSQELDPMDTTVKLPFAGFEEFFINHLPEENTYPEAATYPEGTSSSGCQSGISPVALNPCAFASGVGNKSVSKSETLTYFGPNMTPEGVVRDAAEQVRLLKEELLPALEAELDAQDAICKSAPGNCQPRREDLVTNIKVFLDEDLDEGSCPQAGDCKTIEKEWDGMMNQEIWDELISNSGGQLAPGTPMPSCGDAEESCAALVGSAGITCNPDKCGLQVEGSYDFTCTEFANGFSYHCTVSGETCCTDYPDVVAWVNITITVTLSQTATCNSSYSLINAFEYFRKERSCIEQ